MWAERRKEPVPGKSRKENIFVNGMADELIMTTLTKCVYRAEKKCQCHLRHIKCGHCQTNASFLYIQMNI